MMMHRILFAVLAFLPVSLFAQEAIGFFDQVNVSGKIHVVLSEGSENSIEIINDDDSEVKFEIVHGMLKISKKELWNPNSYEEMVEVNVQYHRLREINGSAGAVVDHPAELISGDLGLHFDTGALGSFQLKAERVEAQAGEGGTIRLTGIAETLEGKAVTGGAIKAGDMQAIRAYVRANTGGFISVRATESLEANATIGGTINYLGDPEEVDIKTSLGGTVTAL